MKNAFLIIISKGGGKKVRSHYPFSLQSRRVWEAEINLFFLYKKPMINSKDFYLYHFVFLFYSSWKPMWTRQMQTEYEKLWRENCIILNNQKNDLKMSL